MGFLAILQENSYNSQWEIAKSPRQHKDISSAIVAYVLLKNSCFILTRYEKKS